MENVTKCRSCGAPIVWIRTRAGKQMPCDANPVHFVNRPKGADLIVMNDGFVLRGDVVTDPAEATGCGHISHFSTCPNADEHRKGGVRK